MKDNKMDSWRPALDEFTMEFILQRLVDDREKHLLLAQDVAKFDSGASEMFLVRAEECARIINQMKKTLKIKVSTAPPPAPEVRLPPPFKTKTWP